MKILILYSEANSKRLQDMYDKWRDNLCAEKSLPLVLRAMSEFMDAYENRSDSVRDAWGEVCAAAGFYRMGHWTFVKHFLGNFNKYLNDFGSVRPEYHKAFKKQYEPRKPLPVEEQVRMLKAQYDLIPHKDDPYRYKNSKPVAWWMRTVLWPWVCMVSCPRLGAMQGSGLKIWMNAGLKSYAFIPAYF